MSKQEEQWVNFYHPDGRLLCGYDETHTFQGEMKNTLELLANENGIQPEQITIKREKGESYEENV